MINKLIIFSGPVPLTCEDINFNTELAESYEIGVGVQGKMDLKLKTLESGKATHFRIIDGEDNCFCQGNVTDNCQDCGLVLDTINLIKGNNFNVTLVLSP